MTIPRQVDHPIARFVRLFWYRSATSRHQLPNTGGGAIRAVLVLLVALAAVATPWHMASRAEGNLASRATRLEPLVLDVDLNFSVKEYQLETGKYYRWRIESDGGEEFLVKAPALFRNAWINQVVINDIEVKPLGGIEGVEFDDAGMADIWFVPIRPGNYDYFVDGFETRGMKGTFIVR